MFICSHYVRECDCEKCLHFKECQNAGTSISKKAHELSKIVFDYAPRLRRHIRSNLSSIGFKINVLSPVCPLFTGAICSIAIVSEKGTKIARFNVYMDTDYETIQDIAENIVNRHLGL